MGVPDTPPTSQTPDVEVVADTTSPHADRDPVLEQQLDTLDIDEDFRESIRAMTPNTRRDVLNDIIRHQQYVGVEEASNTFGMPVNALGEPVFVFAPDGPGGMGGEHDGSHENSDEHDWMNDEAEEEEDVLDLSDDARHHGARPLYPMRPLFAFSRRVADSERDFRHPRSHAFGEHRDGPMNITDFLQLVVQHIGEHPGEALGRQGRAATAQQQQQRSALEERVISLHNLLGMLQQANTLQSMGLDRDIDDMSYEELLALEERIGNVSKGVPPALLESCMTRVEAPAPDETCPICQEELNASASDGTGTAPPPVGADKLCVKLVNCPHMFHTACLKQWLAHNKTCPVCKQEVLPQK
ncbi:hypothetical protein ABB37_02026 [Leptomonas pyrrhocoris]|uniref:RING-type E3 ubiquitin transferase n=1 Tax=Leptomonas pyrrhocoris TaxID=157538 RepID=A0A0N0VGQ6_LEPPY|nr:hypothetical protein ABB37_02026 [Leptomonas pyrrhocoris]KPA83814.1 hypothetical protein ABB37_02026 [Leptomonas pyrrhocoris]|eukprot:XP_015662253.1 hypothetical protein ABB37_02026 [Leptomonas pyrrhocoris]